MDYDLIRSKKSTIKRAESTKSHLWWWDSHIGLKNSKWLENNLDEMDRSVKKMVKLIEEDADSFAKKAEMYYQKRPELLTLVDEFHRMYRSLAERYENITGELRKTTPPLELQSQGSGCFSDVSSSDITTELNRLSRPPSRRAPGFDYFLGGSGGGRGGLVPSDVVYHNKDGDDSASVTDSELESDDSSSVTNYPGYVSVGSDFQYLTKRVADLDLELREAKERVRMHLEGNSESLRVKSEFVDYPAKLAACEQELRDANEKIQNSEDQIYMLKSQLGRYLPSELDDEHGEEASTQDVLDAETLSEELRITTLRLREAEKENGIMRKEAERSRCDDAKLKSLQSLLDSAQKEIAAWKSKYTSDRREVAKLQDRVSMMKHSLAGRDHEIRDLKTALSDAEEKIFPEKAQVKAEIAKLLEEKTHRDEQFKELEAQVRYLEDEIRRVASEKVEEEERLKGEIEVLRVDKAEKERCLETVTEKVSELESEMSLLGNEMEAKESRAVEMEEEVEKQRRELEEVAEEKREVIRQLCSSLVYYRDECKRLRDDFSGHRPTRPSSILSS